MVFVFSLLTASVLFVQVAAAPAAPIVDPLCLAYGALIATVVGMLKRIPFVANNPKWAALLASFLVSAVPVVIHATTITAQVATTLATCVLVQLAGAVASHEILLTPLATAANAAGFKTPKQAGGAP